MSRASISTRHGIRSAVLRALLVFAGFTGPQLTGPQLARAAEDPDERPWAKGTWGVSPSLGLGLSRDLIPLSLGVGGSYFVADGLSFGLSVSDTILIYTSSFRSRFPDVENQIPTNSVYLTPSVRYVFYRNYRFSPYVFGAVGPVFFNHGGGALGYWEAGPAALIGVGGPIYLNLGISFSGIFPTDQCLGAFEYVPPDSPATGLQFDLGCGFGWGPSFGVMFAPRRKAAKRPRKREERREPWDDAYDEPPRNPMGTDVVAPPPGATEVPADGPADGPVDGPAEFGPAEFGPAREASGEPEGAGPPPPDLGPPALSPPDAVPPPGGPPVSGGEGLDPLSSPAGSEAGPPPAGPPPADPPPAGPPPADSPRVGPPPADSPPADSPRVGPPPADSPRVGPPPAGPPRVAGPGS